MIGINLIPIEAIKEHKEDLYLLYKKRKYTISQNQRISFEDHCKFVDNHPYRHWFLVKIKDDLAGAVYIHEDNSIGLNFLNLKESIVEETLKIIFSKFDPLPPKASVRSSNFFINVSHDDKKLQKILLHLGMTCFQSSFR